MAVGCGLEIQREMAAGNGVMTRVRLLLLDGHILFRSTLARVLAFEAGFEIAGQCGTPAEALEILRATAVDITLLDFDAGAKQAGEFVSSARSAGYAGQFLMVAGGADADMSTMALKLGVAGIFLKSHVPEDLVRAIRTIASGAVWIDEQIIHRLAMQCLHGARGRTGQPGALEDREQKVLTGILGGWTNRRIADGMGLSESSVKSVLHGLFRKAGVRTRSQLVRQALEGALGNRALG